MTQKKICMLGSFGVGKTSLVRRFVHGTFDEAYHTTVGVKIDKRQVGSDDDACTLMLWDIHGEDEFQNIRLSYLRGAAGYLLVADGTRADTLERACALQETAEKTTGKVPFLLLLNKADLGDAWTLDEAALAPARERDWPVVRTSARNGEGVEDAFLSLVRAMQGA